MATWTELFGEELLTKDGLQPTTKVLADKKVVGIYFSAHWRPPCRSFTPLLSTTYEELKVEHPDVEFVFASSDHGDQAFTEYFGEMPFVALPFANHEKKALLSDKFQVLGILTLIFLNERDELVMDKGRSVVTKANGDIERLWTQLTTQL